MDFIEVAEWIYVNQPKNQEFAKNMSQAVTDADSNSIVLHVCWADDLCQSFNWDHICHTFLHLIRDEFEFLQMHID